MTFPAVYHSQIITCGPPRSISAVFEHTHKWCWELMRPFRFIQADAIFTRCGHRTTPTNTDTRQQIHRHARLRAHKVLFLYMCGETLCPGLNLSGRRPDTTLNWTVSEPSAGKMRRMFAVREAAVTDSCFWSTRFSVGPRGVNEASWLHRWDGELACTWTMSQVCHCALNTTDCRVLLFCTVIMLTQFMILYFLSAPDVSRSLPEWSAAAFGILVSMVTETQQPGGKNTKYFGPLSRLPQPVSGSADLNAIRGVNMVISAFTEVDQTGCSRLTGWYSEGNNCCQNPSAAWFVGWMTESLSDLCSCRCRLMITTLTLTLFCSFSTVPTYERASLPVFLLRRCRPKSQLMSSAAHRWKHSSSRRAKCL